MGARYVPIVFVADGDKAFEVVQKMTNAFHDLDDASDQTSKGGLRNAFIQADLTSRAIAAGTREVIEAAKEYLQFGRELANVNTLLGDNDSITNFRDGLLELDPALGQTSELARGMYQAISSGVESGEALQFIADSAKTARAGIASTFDTVDAGTSVMASFNLQGKDAVMIYDKMFEVVKRGKVELPQLAQSIGLVSNIAAQAGINLDEMFAAIATASRTNRPSIAIEGMRTAITNILQPSGEATKLAKELGIEFDAQALKAKGLAKFLDDVAKATGGDVEKIAALFGNVQGLNFVLSVTGNQAKTFAEDLKGVAAASGTVDEAFKKQKESIPAQWEALKVSFQQGVIKALLFVEPVLRVVIGLLGSPVFKTAALAVAGLAAAYFLWNSQLLLSAGTQLPLLISNLGNVIRVMFSFSQVTSLSATGLLSFAAGWIGLGAAILVGGSALVKWLFSYESATERASKITREQVDQQGEAIKTSREMAAEVGALAKAQNLSSVEHERLNSIIATLDPNTQRYIKAIDDEKQKVEEVTKALREKAQQQRAQIEAQSILFANAVLETEKNIGKEKANLETWKQSLAEVRSRNADIANQGFGVTAAQRGEINDAAKQVDDLTNSLAGLDKTLAENSVKLVASARAMGMSREEMLAFYAASGFSKERLELLAKAYDNVTGAAQTNAQATNDTTNAIDQQAAAVRDLKKELSDLARVPQAKIDEATLDIVKTARDKAEAKRMAQEAIRNDNGLVQSLSFGIRQSLGQAVQEVRRIREATEGAREVFDPSSRGGSGTRTKREREPREGSAAIGLEALRQAESAIGVREIGGRNRGPEVRQYLESVGLDQGQQWCASFVSYFLKGAEATLKTKSPFPKTASTEMIGKWARENNRFIDEPVPGSVFLEYGRRKGRFAEQHTGFVKSYDPAAGTFTTVEGNYRNQVASVTRQIDPSRYRFVKVDDKTKTDTIDEQRVLYAVGEIMRAAGFKPNVVDGRNKGFVPDLESPVRQQPITPVEEFDTNAQFPLMRLTHGQQAVQDYHEDLLQRERMTAEKRVEIEAWVNMRKREVADDWANEITDRTIRLGELEERMAFRRIENADDQLVEQRRLLKVKEEQNGLEQKLIDLQDELATGPYNKALREQVTLLEAINDLRRRDEDAINDQIRAQVELADATVFHAEQARAQILDHFARQKSLTDSVADSVISITDRAGDAVEKALGKIDRLFGGLFSNLARLAINRVFMRILDAVLPTSSAGAQSGVGQSSGGGGGGIGGFFSNLLGGILRPGGTAPFNPNAGLSVVANALTGDGGITAPESIGERAAKVTDVETILHSATKTGVGAGVGAATTKLGFGAQIAAMAPLLGLSLGASLGGQSGLGQILGGAGGLLAGGSLAAFFAPSIFGTGALGSTLIPFLTNPFTIAGAGVLLIGAYLLSRKKQRDADERTRTTLSGDVYKDTIAILNATRTGDLSLEEATSQFNQVKATYFAGVAQMKDGKTKRIATQWWDNDFYPYYWPLIQQGAAEATQNKANDDLLIPEFADGGAVWRRFADGGLTHPMFSGALKGYQILPDNFLGRVPGMYDRQDDKIVRLTGDEVVLNPSQWKPITSYLKAAKVPGFSGAYADGGALPEASIPTFPSPSNSKKGSGPINIKLGIKFDGKEFVLETMESDAGEEIVLDIMGSYEGQKVTKDNYKTGRKKGSIR
jgi:TP901 family phage tail tape measure protein